MASVAIIVTTPTAGSPGEFTETGEYGVCGGGWVRCVWKAALASGETCTPPAQVGRDPHQQRLGAESGGRRHNSTGGGDYAHTGGGDGGGAAGEGHRPSSASLPPSAAPARGPASTDAYQPSLIAQYLNACVRSPVASAMYVCMHKTLQHQHALTRARAATPHQSIGAAQTRGP